MIQGLHDLRLCDSFLRDASVIDLILEKKCRSLSRWACLDDAAHLSDLHSAGHSQGPVRHGSTFDIWTSSLIIVAYAIPGFPCWHIR